jgi:hypothetical protein
MTLEWMHLERLANVIAQHTAREDHSDIRPKLLRALESGEVLSTVDRVGNRMLNVDQAFALFNVVNPNNPAPTASKALLAVFMTKAEGRPRTGAFYIEAARRFFAGSQFNLPVFKAAYGALPNIFDSGGRMADRGSPQKLRGFRKPPKDWGFFDCKK